MKLHSIETGRFRLDGGAMFGVVPKLLWNRTNPADENNRIHMAARCLLIESNNKLILIDNGIGQKYDPKFASNYAIDQDTTLELSLKKAGFSVDDITDMVLTHLHFDHCGGSTQWTEPGVKAVPVFKNAVYHVQRSHLEWAQNPNPREKASFLKDNIEPLVASGQLQQLDGESEIFPGISLKVVNGHTEAQQLPLISYKGHKILFAADLFPTTGHLPLPYVMGYDVRPLISLDERGHYLQQAVSEKWLLFYEHDPLNELSFVTQNEKGAYTAGELITLSDLA
jgi:glyoxylase-like metal-dependent hydrolase (beta-lactamase superfamily II)